MQNYKFTIIVLAGVIIGMIFNCPTIFVGDIIVGGLIVGFIAAIIGYFAVVRRARKQVSV